MEDGRVLCVCPVRHLLFQRHWAIINDPGPLKMTKERHWLATYTLSRGLYARWHGNYVCVFILGQWLIVRTRALTAPTTRRWILPLTSVVEDRCSQLALRFPSFSTILGDRCQSQPVFDLSFLVKALPWAQILTFTWWSKLLMNKRRLELEQAWSKCQVHLCLPLSTCTRNMD